MNNDRQRVSSFQARLAMVQDNARRKLIDGTNLHWISMPTDCIRLRERKNFEGDPTSWIIDACDVVSAVFPPLNDVPYRKVNVDPTTRVWSLTSLVSAFEDDAQEKFYSLQIPFEFDINAGDLLIRILQDEAQHYAIIIPIQVVEMLGTFGGMKIIMNKCKCTIPTIQLPEKIIETIGQMWQRRRTIMY